MTKDIRHYMRLVETAVEEGPRLDKMKKLAPAVGLATGLALGGEMMEPVKDASRFVGGAMGSHFRGDLFKDYWAQVQREKNPERLPDLTRDALATLTKYQIDDIRRDPREPREIGWEYKVSPETVRAIKRGDDQRLR